MTSCFYSGSGVRYHIFREHTVYFEREYVRRGRSPSCLSRRRSRVTGTAPGNLGRTVRIVTERGTGDGAYMPRNLFYGGLIALNWNDVRSLGSMIRRGERGRTEK